MDTNILYHKDSSNEDSPSSQEHSFYPLFYPLFFMAAGFGSLGEFPHSPFLFFNHSFLPKQKRPDSPSGRFCFA